MRNQYRVVVCEQRAVVHHEVQQMRHLLKVGRNVGVVAAKMRVVKLDADDVLNLAARGV